MLLWVELYLSRAISTGAVMGMPLFLIWPKSLMNEKLLDLEPLSVAALYLGYSFRTISSIGPGAGKPSGNLASSKTLKIFDLEGALELLW